MKLYRLGNKGSEIPAVEHLGKFYSLQSHVQDIDSKFFDSNFVDQIEELISQGHLSELETAGALRRGAPISRPGKIVCIGLNYRDHANETGADIPSEPVVFMKDPDTIVGANDDVFIPRNSVKTDWEVELGVVIGKEARYLDSPKNGLEYVAGYVMSHDVSEREFQLERGGQWDKGKSCETFNPLGPVFVPKSQIADPQNLNLKLWVNGELKQNGSTSNQIFSVEYVIWYLSQFMVLRPGDLINTGTPAGVALGLPGNPYLRAGDEVSLEIDGLGSAKQRFIQA